MRSLSRPCWLYSPGLIPYDVAWQWQRSLVAERRQHPDHHDVLLLLQHPPVYTLGQGASMEFVKAELQQQGVPLVRIERGGEVTYHCPGQLVGYPILNLQHHTPDLHWYLRQLEEVIIQAIAPLGLEGHRIEGLTGVWVEGRKVAAIGIKVSRWITMHGFALNICPDLHGFQHIVPCGITDRPVGSLAEWLPDIQYSLVEQQVKQAFSQIFHVELWPTDTLPLLPVPLPPT
ncbi:MAG: lipoyl(octanoyl) transferase LipB [Synechococcales cyanobacterium K44_A2020_017]|nr:lipoyl(octanoyl) transferase LipB [Synechococcales cyanobacterium K32_A2020_035]MBF2095624.1 lipoyl(octanoyl) transferase LipB [Synechococcales cyanobacterium K44_A2020_017]